jgi:hypothetical protein
MLSSPSICRLMCLTRVRLFEDEPCEHTVLVFTWLPVTADFARCKGYKIIRHEKLNKGEALGNLNGVPKRPSRTPNCQRCSITCGFKWLDFHIHEAARKKLSVIILPYRPISVVSVY